MPQESFEFGFDAPLEKDDFIASQSNIQALSFIERWPHWSSHAVLLYGPKACGKTHLTRIWQKRTHAPFLTAREIYSARPDSVLSDYQCAIIEDIDHVHDEAALLHFFNAVKEIGGWLMLTTQKHPSNLGIRLPDLKSRLHSIPLLGVNPPDDALLQQIYQKQFSDRQLKVGMDVIQFLVNRVERSFEAVYRIVDILDKQALTERKNITVPFSKKVLEEMGQLQEEVVD